MNRKVSLLSIEERERITNAIRECEWPPHSCPICDKRIAELGIGQPMIFSHIRYGSCAIRPFAKNDPELSSHIMKLFRERELEFLPSPAKDKTSPKKRKQVETTSPYFQTKPASVSPSKSKLKRTTLPKEVVELDDDDSDTQLPTPKKGKRKNAPKEEEEENSETTSTKYNDKDVEKIRKILDSRTVNGQKQYLVSWYGYESDEDCWIPSNVILDKFIVEEYEEEMLQKS